MIGYNLPLNIPDLYNGTTNITVNDADVGNDLDVEHDITGADSVTFDTMDANPGGASTLWVDNAGTLRLGSSVVGDTLPAGADTEIQYNNGGDWGASNSLTFDGTTLAAPTLMVGGDTYNPAFGICTDGNSRHRIGNLDIHANQIHPIGASSIILGATGSITVEIDSDGNKNGETFTIFNHGYATGERVLSVNEDEDVDGEGKLTVVNMIDNKTTDWIARMLSTKTFRITDDSNKTLFTVSGSGGLVTLTSGIEMPALSANPGTNAIYYDGSELYFGADKLTNQSPTIPGSVGQFLKSTGAGTMSASANVFEKYNLLFSKYGFSFDQTHANDYKIHVDNSTSPAALTLTDNGNAYRVVNLYTPSAGSGTTTEAPIQLADTNAGHFATDAQLYHDRVSHVTHLPNLYVPGTILFAGEDMDGSDSDLIRLVAWDGDSNAAHYKHIVTPTDLDSTTSGANLRLSSLGSGEIFRDSSSRRYKTGIEDVDLSAAVLTLQPVTYMYKTDIKRQGSDALPAAGFIAEEAFDGSPLFCSYLETDDPDKYPNALVYRQQENGRYLVVDGIENRAIIAALVALAKKDHKRIAKLERKLARSEARVSQQNTEIMTLMENVNTLREDIAALYKHVKATTKKDK